MADDEPPTLGEDTERQRRQVLEPFEFDALRTEPTLRQISEAIVELCDVSMAHVSVMEDDRQCVIGRVGFDRDYFSRDQSLCAYTLANQKLTVVEDTTDDARSEASPYVRESPHIRFYVGVPLEIQGIPAGTLCAMDDEPREFDERMRAKLIELARLVERYLETKAIADSDDDPRQQLAAQITTIAALTARVDARLSSDRSVGELVEGFKDAVERSYDAIGGWIEEEHEASFD